MQVGVITNPNSRKNKGRPNRAAELQSIIGNHGEVHSTDTVESIKPILREFLRKRAQFWVADGGDGALHWLLRSGMEVLQEDEFAGASLPLTLPTKGGTIDFVANHAGIEGSGDAVLESLRHTIEAGKRIQETEVDSVLVEGVQLVDGKEVSFRTYGFAVAAAGIGQQFFTKYYEDADPNPATIVKVVANALATIPLSYSPLGSLPGIPDKWRNYARDVMSPARARVTLDGMVLPESQFTGIHVASMAINIGDVFRFFTKAKKRGQMHAIVGTLTPLELVRNIPRMHLGKELVGKNTIDRACREMTVEAIGDESFSPIIDGESYDNVRSMTLKLGPSVRIPKLVTDESSH